MTICLKCEDGKNNMKIKEVMGEVVRLQNKGGGEERRQEWYEKENVKTKDLLDERKPLQPRSLVRWL